VAAQEKSKSFEQDLFTLKNIIFGEELRAMQASIKEIESTLSAEIKSIKNDLTRAVEDLKKQVTKDLSAFGMIVKSEETTRAEACSKLDSRLTALTNEVNARVQSLDKSGKENMAYLRQDFEQRLQSQKSDFMAKSKMVDDSITSMQAELKVRKAESGKMVSFLSNFARSIADGAPAAEAEAAPRAQSSAQRATHAAPAAASKKHADGGDGQDLPGSDDLLSNIDNMFNLPK